MFSVRQATRPYTLEIQCHYQHNKEMATYLNSNPIPQAYKPVSWEESRRDPILLFPNEMSLPILRMSVNEIVKTVSFSQVLLLLHDIGYLEMQVILALSKICNLSVYVLTDLKMTQPAEDLLSVEMTNNPILHKIYTLAEMITSTTSKVAKFYSLSGFPKDYSDHIADLYFGNSYHISNCFVKRYTYFENKLYKRTSSEPLEDYLSILKDNCKCQAAYVDQTIADMDVDFFFDFFSLEKQFNNYYRGLLYLSWSEMGDELVKMAKSVIVRPE